MSEEKLLKHCEKVIEYLGEHGAFYEVEPFGAGMPVIRVHVVWGDWKHDHLRLNYLMEELGYVSLGSDVTEEDGSDSYSAVHYYLVKGDIE